MSNIVNQTFDPIYVSPDNQATTASYVDVTGSKIDTFSKTKVCYTCKNAHVSNSINWKVLCSNDDSSYVEAQAEATLAAGAIGSYTNTLATYRYYKVQVLTTSNPDHGTAQVRGFSKA
ncbi:MAG: hypothetical protein EHM20_00050 [Alphaproteobacteria bacterium]|nr:MAG: hypothetical protein EHM20_12790 [Alphaproteobacteria bacterium]RPJ79815.1 MAG: hypothetical protein EHM20_00050 [Alphaproteobacteria bacterium]